MPATDVIHNSSEDAKISTVSQNFSKDAEETMKVSSTVSNEKENFSYNSVITQEKQLNDIATRTNLNDHLPRWDPCSPQKCPNCCIDPFCAFSCNICLIGLCSVLLEGLRGL